VQTTRFLCKLATAFFVFGAPILRAQALADILSGPMDVLYSQSATLSSLDPLGGLPSETATISPLPASDQPSSPETNRTVDPLIQDHTAPDHHFRFFPAFGESWLFTGIMHAFNIATEAGTRDALNGPWLKDYLRSVSELRGWSDSDKFMAPYVGHPIEGSVFGFIERQNDPQYRLVQWGDGREYWVSMLRSMAYSARYLVTSLPGCRPESRAIQVQCPIGVYWPTEASPVTVLATKCPKLLAIGPSSYRAADGISPRMPLCLPRNSRRGNWATFSRP
jgi:hypothetical protein